MGEKRPVRFTDLFRYYRGLPHQIAALEMLGEAIPASLMHRDNEWFKVWSQDGKQADYVTAAQLRTMGANTVTDQQVRDLNDCLRMFNITSPARIRHFLAQTMHESGLLRWMTELASGGAYEGRSDLGNTQTGDGRRFKGAGALQLTGRYNYQLFADYMGDERVMEGADYVSVRYPFTSAGFWWQQNGINAFVDSGASCRQISARVNGRDPANGLAERERLFAAATNIIRA